MLGALIVRGVLQNHVGGLLAIITAGQWVLPDTSVA